MNSLSSMLRVAALTALAVGIWALAKYGQAVPAVAPADAPATQFSAMRANATLGRILGPERPHPASTAENAAVRGRIIAEFAKLGVTASPYTGTGCEVEKRGAAIVCGTVTDILAPVIAGTGKAIVLLAHYDSVPAGPGAADDGSGVATVLETVRALKAGGGASKHPVIAVLTDGEEYGLLGADAFLANPAFKDKVGAVINVEARGNQGQSRLFQTSPGDGRLIDLYDKAVPVYATSSLYAEIYKYMPNDTDLTLFIRDGITSFNFAFADNVAHYHTPLDTRAHLSLVSLQEQGDNMLGVARALQKTEYADLKGPDDVYLDVLGRWLPRIPESWALPGAVILLLLIGGAVAVSHGRKADAGEWLRAVAIFPLLLIGAAASGFLLMVVAQTVSGMPDPAYAYPAVMRIALGFGLGAAVLGVARLSGARAAAGAVWLWLAVCGVAVAAYLPGISPYFLLPCGAAAVLLIASARFGWESPVGEGALLVASVIALVIWMQLVASGETLMGLKLHLLFTLPAAIGLATLVPLMPVREWPLRDWLYSVGGFFAVGLVAAVVAGLQPAYSAIAPQRLNLNYLVTKADGTAQWAADATAPLPEPLRKAANFAREPKTPYPGTWRKAYLAPAPQAHLKMPSVAVLANGATGTMRTVTLGLDGSSDTAQMMLVLPGGIQLRHMTLGQRRMTVPAGFARAPRILIGCMTADCASMPVTLEMADKGAIKFDVIERRAGLPPSGDKLRKARPETAVPSQMGDGTILVSPVTVPAVN